MLSIVKQPKYVEKLVTMPNGQVLLVIFELVQQLNGRIIAKAVSGRMISDTAKEEVLCLPCVKTPTDFLPIKSIFSDLVSNISKDFSFIMSQPTRAPASI
jgi:hypothetical protein